MITWITGNSGSGKTTLANELAKLSNAIILDGNAMRWCWTLGFSKEDRYENNIRIAKIAKTLEDQNFDVIVATICPYRDLRRIVTEICNPKWIYLTGGVPVSEEYPYEESENHIKQMVKEGIL